MLILNIDFLQLPNIKQMIPQTKGDKGRVYSIIIFKILRHEYFKR